MIIESELWMLSDLAPKHIMLSSQKADIYFINYASRYELQEEYFLVADG